MPEGNGKRGPGTLKRNEKLRNIHMLVDWRAGVNNGGGVGARVGDV
jgi:hypothetical protein